MIHSLDGIWRLSSTSLNSPIAGQVPGNLELDLVNAGLEPDPFFGENQKAFRKYAFDDWTYTTTFDTPEGFAGDVKLVFEAVDCFADIILNGKHVAFLDNALIPHRLDAVLAPVGQPNKLEVIIRSSERVARQSPEVVTAIDHIPQAHANLWLRKPAHSFGWDIAPRLNLGGIWRSVTIVKEDTPATFDELWVSTRSCSQASAALDVYYSFHTELPFLEDMEIELAGACGESTFQVKQQVFDCFGHAMFSIHAPKLWQPFGYGEPNLYDLKAKLIYKGETVATTSTHFGIRTVKLERSDLNIAGTGHFRFIVNGQPVRIHGANWVPADALHSRDLQRIPKCLELFRETNCNMIRCWGGGVYENDIFYDYCDRHGILVWQDFMFSGHKYPQEPKFLEKVRVEAETIVRRLRSKTCIAIWCGDNECDQKYLAHREDPRTNKINRQVLPDVLTRMDDTRPFLPSSPYLADKIFDYAGLDNVEAMTILMPERHLWGSRETFRQSFYTSCGAKFVAEMGWHGCPSLTSMVKYIDSEQLKLDTVDLSQPQLVCHASCPWESSGLRGRNNIMPNQNDEYFTDPPKDLRNFILASQIHQAEAFKYVVEHYRMDPTGGGIIWWNVIDCWPQLSDAVVDYYFNKKLAFYYLARTQQPFAIMADDVKGFHSNIVAVNDTDMHQQGRVTLTDGETGDCLATLDFSIQPRSIATIGRLRNKRATNRLWLINWESSGRHGTNHFIAGNRTMSYKWYKSILPTIAKLDNTFQLDGTEVIRGEC